MTIKRPNRSLGDWSEAGMTLKLYGITTGSTEFPTDSLIAASKELARQSIGDIFEPSASGTAFPYGFLRIHQGDGFNFIFLCWWAPQRVDAAELRLPLGHDDCAQAIRGRYDRLHI